MVVVEEEGEEVFEEEAVQDEEAEDEEEETNTESKDMEKEEALPEEEPVITEEPTCTDQQLMTELQDASLNTSHDSINSMDFTHSTTDSANTTFSPDNKDTQQSTNGLSTKRKAKQKSIISVKKSFPLEGKNVVRQDLTGDNPVILMYKPDYFRESHLTDLLFEGDENEDDDELDFQITENAPIPEKDQKHPIEKFSSFKIELNTEKYSPAHMLCLEILDTMVVPKLRQLSEDKEKRKKFIDEDLRTQKALEWIQDINTPKK